MAFSAFLTGVSALIAIYLIAQKIAQWRTRANLIRANHCQPAPSVPLKDPILGLDYFLDGIKAFKEKNTLERIRHHFDLYGATFAYTQLGWDYIATKDPANLKAVLSADFASYGVQPDRYIPLKPMAGQNFFSVDGPLWKDSRERIKPVISRNEYSDLARLEVFVQRWLDLMPRDGSTIDMQPLCVRLLNDYMTEYLFGKSTDSLTPISTVDQQAITSSIHLALINSTTRFMLGSFLGPLLEWVPLPKDVTKAIGIVHDYIDGTVQDALDAQTGSGKGAAATDHYVFLQELVKSSSDKEWLRNIALVMYVAGTDTTANILGHMIWALARNKQAVETLRKEIAPVEGHGLDLPTLQKLPYLRAVINETIRLYPISAINNRTCTSDTILPRGGGSDGQSPVFVKKGTRVLLGFQARHYDKSVWGADAEEFRPERWLEGKPATWDFLPFGGGGRVCPGQYLALANLSYIIVRLLQEFKDIESRDDRPFTEELRLISTNANGALVGLTPA